jgi:HAD superfamily hydrolase (TIGR01509 family)
MTTSGRFEFVIFDCDGVLIDSETVAIPVLGTMLSELGADLEIDELHRRFGGLSYSQLLQVVGETIGRPPPTTFEADLSRRWEVALGSELVPIPGVTSVLEGLRLPFCTASNAESDEIRFNLDVAGLRHHFEDRIFTATDVEHPKPAPDLYLLAAEVSGVDPSLCAVVEDTPTGVAAGTAAGMHVLGYSTRHPREALVAAGARETFRDMDELLPLLHA